MNASHGTGHWGDPAWRRSLTEQQADTLAWLRLLLTRHVAWLRHRAGHDPLDGPAAVVTDAQADAALRGPDPVAEAEFHRQDPVTARLGRSIDRVRTQLDERAAAADAAGTPFPIDALAGLVGLDAFAHGVLLLALAPELDPSFARLYAYAQDDAARRHLTPALAVALLPGPPDGEPATTFRPDATLFACALLRHEGAADDSPAAARPLRLPPRVRWYLQGVDVPDQPRGVRFSERAARSGAGELAVVAAGVVRALGGHRRDTPPPLVNLVGRDRRQAAALADRIAADAGLRLHTAVLDGSADPGSATAFLERESRLRATAVLLDAGGGADRADAVLELAERLSCYVLLASAHPARTARGTLTVSVPAPRPGTRRALWTQAIPELVDDPRHPLDAVVHHFPTDPDTVTRVAAAARGTARLRGEPPTSADVWEWCRRHGRRHLDGLAEVIEPAVGWDDIVLPGDVRAQLGEIVAQVRHRSLVYEQWGFGDALARGRGITALFAGPSGTGKTMAAEVLATALELDLYRIDLAGVVDKYIGETEKNLRRVFDSAEASGAVLFFDEADALFGKRTEVRDSHDRYANIEVNYLLQRMEGYGGLAILATNRRSVLDRAFLRRLAFLVDFPFPTAKTRLRIWQKVLPGGAPLEGVDFGALARMELAGGNIRSVALNGAFLAAADGGRITMDALMHAAAREYAKLDKAPTDAEFGRYPRAVGS